MIDRQNAHNEDNTQNSVMFTREELDLFIRTKSNGMTTRTIQHIRQIGIFVWDNLQGRIDPVSLQNFSEFILSRYESRSARNKCFLYGRMFLMYLYKLRLDPRILSYHNVFQKPNNRKIIKLVTSRIITVEDIRSVIASIEGDRSLPEQKKEDYRTQVLFLSYSGQRVSTVSRLTVGQFREALEQEYPVLKVEADQDKVRMEHLVPLSPVLVPHLQRFIGNRSDDELMFNYLSLQRWLKNHPVPMIHTKGKLELKDLRKFFESHSDFLGFTDANKSFVMSHGVSSINFTSYKSFLPENIYKVYMQAWGSVSI